MVAPYMLITPKLFTTKVLLVGAAGRATALPVYKLRVPPVAAPAGSSAPTVNEPVVRLKVDADTPETPTLIVPLL
jgi:hypothetical protein